MLLSYMDRSTYNSCDNVQIMHPYVKYQDMYDSDVVDETRHFVAKDNSMKPITARGASQLNTRGVTQSTQRSWTTGTKRQRGRGTRIGCQCRVAWRCGSQTSRNATTCGASESWKS